MKWDKYTIQTTTTAEDFLSAMLAELGIEGIEIENHIPLSEEELQGMFIDFPPELGEDDGTSKVSFYLEAGEDHTALLKQVKAGIEELREYTDLGEGTITSDQTEDLDWINNWKQYFHSFTIDDILIKPTWEPLAEEDRDKFLIEIDPGISFGTGKHETTQLCIRQLRKYMKQGDKVADLGCGSGILTITALKLGAGELFGTDIDENCMISTRENLEVNHLNPEEVTLICGNLIDDTAMQERLEKEQFDLITANILADVIIPMAPQMYRILRTGGTLITSGIIDFKEQEVAKALESCGFTILEINHQGEWVNVTATKEA